MRVAAIDCGTNTIKLLVLQTDTADTAGAPLELEREMRIVRLGQGVDRTGRLAPEALERTFAACEEYADLLSRHGVDTLRFCATSATRDAANAAEFAAGVEQRLGVVPDVLTGAEEAALSYAGATRGVRRPDPVLVIDVGGGSTELVLGSGETPDAASSMDVGSVRLTERHLADDPPTAAQIAAAAADVDAALDQALAAGVDPAAAATVVGVAGTVTTLAAGVLGLTEYSREAIDGAVLSYADLEALTQHLLTLDAAGRRELAWLHPGRADVIVAGAVVLARVLARTSATELVVSESDILDGIAWDLAAGG
ncbi:Ppx/GppA phosphatase family protein [Nocardioides acrostichi]|uniref:Exopolyphosphatase n=1 Tax=Nocardioides acrostichi TaxID=2784339 RepID=A0A930V369_9ACTN|nr:exopolyphosphatase [Nocardioides acrostichi]MBF4162900.1 exopolyphosphatase [Nocardioides acrostichi]